MEKQLKKFLDLSRDDKMQYLAIYESQQGKDELYSLFLTLSAFVEQKDDGYYAEAAKQAFEEFSA